MGVQTEASLIGQPVIAEREQPPADESSEEEEEVPLVKPPQPEPEPEPEPQRRTIYNLSLIHISEPTRPY